MGNTTRHESDFTSLERLLEDRMASPYRPTFSFDGPYINDNHQFYAAIPTHGAKIAADVPGSLRREDALKLYELAYFTRGNVLEIGTGNGLSTSIMLQAMNDAGSQGRIYTTDLSRKAVDIARSHVRSERVKFHVMEGTAFVDEMLTVGRKFGFVFVDHAHTYQPVKSVVERLPAAMWKGVFCLFHDYKDWRNADPDEDDYQVYQAVEDGLDRRKFDFYGLYGCTALYRRKTGPFSRSHWKMKFRRHLASVLSQCVGSKTLQT